MATVTAPCPYCKTSIDAESSRCPHCAGQLAWCLHCDEQVAVTARNKWVGIVWGATQKQYRCAQCGSRVFGAGVG